MRFLKALDGYKRIIVLALYMGAALIQASGHGDYSGQLGFVLQLLNWTPDLLPVPMSVLAGTAAGTWAIGSAVRKILAERRAVAETVTLPR